MEGEKRIFNEKRFPELTSKSEMKGGQIARNEQQIEEKKVARL